MAGDVHRVAAAVLVADGRVLLGHRHPDREHYPDCWDAIGGHIEPGETPEQGLVRECREELGVTVAVPRHVSTQWLAPDLELNSFVVDTWSGSPTNLAPEEHDALGWFAPDEVSALLLAHPEVAALAADALSG